jgi:streptomycin 6-kinase
MPRAPRGVSVPSGLEWWREEPDGSIWLQHLPDIVGECVARWSLRLGEPFHNAHVSYVAPVELHDRTPAVLKINFPEPEGEREPDALGHWGGAGAVRLLGRYDERRALLVERCEPGTRLWETRDGDDVTRIVAGVLRRLWRPPREDHPFCLLADVAAEWAEELPRGWDELGRPYEESLLDEAVAFLREAGPAQGEQVVLHQDLHGGNVLHARRELWLAIDPKPLVGEREFDTASFLRDRRWELRNDPDAGARVRRRLDLLGAELDLDRDRMRGWGAAHALAWGISGKELDRGMADCARWLAAA